MRQCRPHQHSRLTVVVLADLQTKATEKKGEIVTLVRNPEFQHRSLATAGGTIVVGSVGGAFGCASGILVGSAAGVVPALLTFGLSLPAGAVVGGGVGGCLGAAAGTLSGLVGGGASGGVAYRYRAEIGDGAVHVKVKALRAKDRAAEKAQELQMVANSWVGSAKAHAGGTVQALSDATSEAAERAKVFGHVAAASVRLKASEFGTNAKALALNPAAQATSAGAAGGSVTVGAAGGGLGLLAGGAVGAACAVPAAFFTFGLSIPVGIAIGAGSGLCIGSSAEHHQTSSPQPPSSQGAQPDTRADDPKCAGSLYFSPS